MHCRSTSSLITVSIRSQSCCSPGLCEHADDSERARRIVMACKDVSGRFPCLNSTHLRSREPIRLVRAGHAEAVAHRDYPTELAAFTAMFQFLNIGGKYPKTSGKTWFQPNMIEILEPWSWANRYAAPEDYRGNPGSPKEKGLTCRRRRLQSGQDRLYPKQE